MPDTVTVNLHGRSFKLINDATTDVLALAEMVNARIKQLEREVGPMQPLDVALLTALHFAEEVMKTRAHYAAYRPPTVPHELIERFNRLLDLLDNPSLDVR